MPDAAVGLRRRRRRRFFAAGDLVSESVVAVSVSDAPASGLWSMLSVQSGTQMSESVFFNSLDKAGMAGGTDTNSLKRSSVSDMGGWDGSRDAFSTLSAKS